MRRSCGGAQRACSPGGLAGGVKASRAGCSPLPEEQQGLLEAASCSSTPDMLEAPISGPVRRLWVFVFAMLVALLSADQNLLAPHLTQAAHDFRMNADERDQYLGGYIMASFFAIGAPASLMVGWLTDRCNRRNLLFTVVMIGATPALATYWVTQYWQLLVLRTLTGISVGGVAPLIFSLLGDLFPISERCTMAAFIGVCAGLGGTAGQAISDLTGANNWRLPFVVVSAPTLLLACIMMGTTQDPPRGCFEEALQSAYSLGGDYEYKETITWEKVRQLLCVKSNWIIFIQGLPGCLPWGMIITFLNDYLAQDQGFTVHMSTTIVLVYGLGGIVGSVVGGCAGQWLYNRRKEWMPVLVGSCIMAGMWPLYFLVNAPLAQTSLHTTLTIAALGGLVAGVAAPNIRAVTMNVNQPETRGVAFALQTTTDDLGKGLGPFIVASLIKFFGRRTAFNAAIAGWVPCGALIICLVFCMREDEADMQRRLQQDCDAAASLARKTAAASVDARDAMETETNPLLLIEDARLYILQHEQQQDANEITRLVPHKSHHEVLEPMEPSHQVLEPPKTPSLLGHVVHVGARNLARSVSAAASSNGVRVVMQRRAPSSLNAAAAATAVAPSPTASASAGASAIMPGVVVVGSHELPDVESGGAAGQGGTGVVPRRSSLEAPLLPQLHEAEAHGASSLHAQPQHHDSAGGGPHTGHSSQHTSDSVMSHGGPSWQLGSINSATHSSAAGGVTGRTDNGCEPHCESNSRGAAGPWQQGVGKSPQ